MGDELVVGGGGTFSVGTATLFSHAQRLESMQGELSACADSLDRLGRATWVALVSRANLPPSAMRAERAVDDAIRLLRGAAARSGALAAALRLSAVGYGTAETVIAAATQSLAAQLGIGLGFLASTAGFLALPGMLALLSAGGLGFAVSSLLDPTGTRRAIDGAVAWLNENKSVLSDPRLIELVRFAVMSADDVGAGALKLPPPIIRLLGDEGIGLIGLDTSAAAAVVGGGLLGAFRETPVTRASSWSAETRPATGYADRAARVPGGSSQVRIDRYLRPGEPARFEVYIGGTIDSSPAASTQPWDMTSNVTAMAGGDAGSYRAVRDALELAGADASSQLVITGYSQGGLVASMLAASGDYDVRGLYTLGAPAGQVPVPPDIPWVAIEHTDDLVPAVGGTWASTEPVIVRREAFAERPLDDRLAFPAHQLSMYRETAALVDSAEERRLVTANEGFTAFGRGVERVESTWYDFDRVPAVPQRS